MSTWHTIYQPVGLVQASVGQSAYPGVVAAPLQPLDARIVPELDAVPGAGGDQLVPHFPGGVALREVLASPLFKRQLETNLLLQPGSKHQKCLRDTAGTAGCQ